MPFPTKRRERKGTHALLARLVASLYFIYSFQVLESSFFLFAGRLVPGARVESLKLSECRVCARQDVTLPSEVLLPVLSFALISPVMNIRFHFAKCDVKCRCTLVCLTCSTRVSCYGHVLVIRGMSPFKRDRRCLVRWPPFLACLPDLKARQAS